MRRLLCAAFTMTGFALSASATMHVSSHVERGRDFSQYRTFDWGLPDTLPIGDPRLDRDPFFRETAQRGDLVLKR